MKTLYALCAVAFFLLSSAQAQNSSPIGRFVEGEVSPERGSLPDDLLVEMYDLESHRKIDQVPIQRNGHFQFRNISPGNYWIKIVNSRGNVIRESLATIQQSFGPLSLQIPSPEPVHPGGAVSVNRMLHPIPQKAVKEFMHAQEASEQGLFEQSVAHLEKAIQIFPDYPEAHNNLGARYLRLGQFDNALRELETAVALNPQFAMAHINLAVVWMNKRNYPESEAAARRALQFEPQSVPARYMLGRVLVLEDKNSSEALDSLRKSVDTFPKIRLVIAQLLVRQGARSAAAVELRKYLASGQSENRVQVQAWLAQLEP